MENGPTACSTEVNVSLSFGGKTWAISPDDFMMTTAGGGRCIGAFFSLGTSTPAWIIGDTFLVRLALHSWKDVSCAHIFSQKNVYSVFRYNPASVGFAQLSETALAMNKAGGSVPTATIGSVVAVATNGSNSSNSAPAQAVSMISRSSLFVVGLSVLYLVL